MATLWQDLKHGVRMLGHSPAFTVTVALTLALGIGANAAVFSVINTLLLRPIPGVSNPDNLYIVGVTHEGNEEPHAVSWPDYVDYRDRSGVFSDLAAYAMGFAGLSADGRADRIFISYVTGNFFSMVGVKAGYGRLILPAEGQKYGADPVIVLGHSFWRHRFAADPSVVGRQVLVNGRPFTVIGIVPQAFAGVNAVFEFDAYIPHGMMPESDYKEQTQRRDSHDLRTLGRLKAGVSLRQAQAAVDLLSRQLEQQYPATNKTVRARVIPERLARPEPNAAESNPFVAGVFMLLVGLVLLVACVNVINLLLARATVRQRELAVRAALGAGRTRLVRQLLTESLLLAAAGGLAGAVLGRWLSGMLAGITLPMDLPIRFDLAFDWRVFGYIAAIALGAGIAVGLVPALRASRGDINGILRDGGRGVADGSSSHWLRNLLVVSQVAVSVVLLVAAGLFVRSVHRAQTVDLGFHPQHVLNLSMDVGQQAYTEVRGRAFYRDLQERVRALPGVESASYAFSVPFGYYNANEFVEAEGQPISTNQRRPSAGYNMVGPDYFRTLGITIVRGRAFTEQDDQRSRPVAIVNEFMAGKFWPGQDPIGKRFQAMNEKGKWLEIVGVTRSGKYNYIFEDPRMYFFVPIEQKYAPMRALHVRTAGAAELLGPIIQKEIRALDPDLPIYDVRPMTRVLDGPNGFFLLQMGALFGGGLGLLGLVLAMVGIYGVVSYTAGQRTQEIGVRMALGARPADILRLVVGHGLVLVGVGVGLGLVGAFGVALLLKTMLFGISAVDPVTFVFVPLALALMAAIASYLPAFRATKVDPMVALRIG